MIVLELKLKSLVKILPQVSDILKIFFHVLKSVLLGEQMQYDSLPIMRMCSM